MLARPNATLLSAEIVGLSPHKDGRGFEVEVKVASNLTENVADDFLRSKPGDLLKLYAANAPAFKVGDRCKVGARLLGGPFAQQAILTDAEKLD